MTGGWGMAASATLHCLTGCAIGEILGMVIGTAPGWSSLATVVLAADTFSIAVMELVDNAVMVAIPGAMHGGVGNLLFWGALAFALSVAFVVALPVNRWLIARGKGHAVVHETGVHGGPPPALIGTLLAGGFVFGTVVLAAELA